MIRFYEKLRLLKKITNYWHLNFLLLIAPKGVGIWFSKCYVLSGEVIPILFSGSTLAGTHTRGEHNNRCNFNVVCKWLQSPPPSFLKMCSFLLTSIRKILQCYCNMFLKELLPLFIRFYQKVCRHDWILNGFLKKTYSIIVFWGNCFPILCQTTLDKGEDHMFSV